MGLGSRVEPIGFRAGGFKVFGSSSFAYSRSFKS